MKFGVYKSKFEYVKAVSLSDGFVYFYRIGGDSRCSQLSLSQFLQVYEFVNP